MALTTNNARNDLGRLKTSISPSMLVLNSVPRRLMGDDLAECAEARLEGDSEFARLRARKAKTEIAWIQARTWAQLDQSHRAQPMKAHQFQSGAAK